MRSRGQKWDLLSKRFRGLQSRPFCTHNTTNKHTNTKPNNNNGSNTSISKEEVIAADESSSLSISRQDAYKELEHLNFMTAAKILFTTPPKKKKFGIDFHLVQLFFACMPSLAVYLVAQYARSEMRRMEAELEVKKKAEEEAKAKEMELKAAEEHEVKSDPQLLEVKVRLDKLEETVKEMVVESKKKSSNSRDGTQVDNGDIKQPTMVKPNTGATDASSSNTKGSPSREAGEVEKERELEVKKKAEEEAKAKEMELKAAEEHEVKSDPQLLEVKVRLDKLEETVKEMVVESKKKSSNSRDGTQVDNGDIKQPTMVKPNTGATDASSSNTKGSPSREAGEGRTSSTAPTGASQHDQKSSKNDVK